MDEVTIKVICPVCGTENIYTGVPADAKRERLYLCRATDCLLFVDPEKDDINLIVVDE